MRHTKPNRVGCTPFCEWSNSTDRFVGVHLDFELAEEEFRLKADIVFDREKSPAHRGRAREAHVALEMVFDFRARGDEKVSRLMPICLKELRIRFNKKEDLIQPRDEPT